MSMSNASMLHSGSAHDALDLSSISSGSSRGALSNIPAHLYSEMMPHRQASIAALLAQSFSNKQQQQQQHNHQQQGGMRKPSLLEIMLPSLLSSQNGPNVPVSPSELSPNNSMPMPSHWQQQSQQDMIAATLANSPLPSPVERGCSHHFENTQCFGHMHQHQAQQQCNPNKRRAYETFPAPAGPFEFGGCKDSISQQEHIAQLALKLHASIRNDEEPSYKKVKQEIDTASMTDFERTSSYSSLESIFSNASRPKSRGKLCKFADCDKLARGRGFCKRHGGGRRCQTLNCQRSARSGSKFCTSHGGGRRCQADGCTKGAEGATFFCVAHGGGRRCQKSGCTKKDQGSGFCKSHGGGKRCALPACQRSVKTGTNYCSQHFSMKTY